MGAPKGSKNAVAYHADKTKKRLAEIKVVLQSIVKTGLMVSNITALSNYVSNQIETTGVTLRRNAEYRKELESHLVKQRGSSMILSDRDRQAATLRAKMKVMELDLSNTKADKRRLELALENASKSPALAAPEGKKKLRTPSSSSNIDFVSTATLVLVLLERMDGFEVDEDKEAIVDRFAKSGQELVAGPNLCRPFIAWMKRTRENDPS